MEVKRRLQHRLRHHTTPRSFRCGHCTPAVTHNQHPQMELNKCEETMNQDNFKILPLLTNYVVRGSQSGWPHMDQKEQLVSMKTFSSESLCLEHS